MKRKARKWWIIGGAAFLLTAVIYLSSPSWAWPYRFLHGAGYAGMSQNINGSLTFRIYDVPSNESKGVLSEAESELSPENGWKLYWKTDEQVSYVNGDDFIEFRYPRKSNDTMTVLVRRPARVIDKWLVDLPWNKRSDLR